MAKAKFVKDLFPIDVSTWTWGADDWDKVIGKAVSATLKNSLKDAVRVELAFNGESVKDPLAIDIDLPFGAHEHDEPTWRISIKDLLDDWCFLHGDFERKTIQQDSYAEDLAREMANAFRAFADKIEARIK